MNKFNLLQFLYEKSIQNTKYVSGIVCIDSLSLTEQEFIEMTQILEDDGHVHVLTTKSTLPQIKISPKGRKFLRNGDKKDQSTSSTIYHVENMTNVSGNVYGGISQSDNRTTITQKLEKLQSEIRMQDILDDTKRELIQKIDEIKTEHVKNTDSSREKITKIISDVGNIATGLAPVLSKILGL